MTVTITTILLVFSLLLGGTGVTVFAAQESLPEQPLYAIKMLSEDLAVEFPQSSSSRLDLYLDFASRRVTEIISLAGSGLEPSEGVVLRLESQLDRALQLASEMEGDQMLHALSQVRTRLQSHARILADQPQVSALMTRTRETVQTRLGWAEFGLSEPEQFRLQARERNQFNQPPDGLGSHGPGPNPGSSGNGYGPGPNQTPGAGDGDGYGPHSTSTPIRGSGYGPGSDPDPSETPGDGVGNGPGPYATGTPNPGSGYGPGPGPDPSQTPGTKDGNGPGPHVTGTPTPGSGYGPGPGPDPTCTCPNPDPGHEDGGESEPHPPEDKGGGGK